MEWLLGGLIATLIWGALLLSRTINRVGAQIYALYFLIAERLPPVEPTEEINFDAPKPEHQTTLTTHRIVTGQY